MSSVIKRALVAGVAPLAFQAGNAPPPALAGEITTPVSTQGCADIEFLGLRGSGETDLASQLGMGETLYKSYQKFKALSWPTTWAIKGIGVGKAEGYTAASVDVLPSQLLRQAWRLTYSPNALEEGLRPYTVSVASGVKSMVTALKQRHTQCPQTNFVVAGYSQGAIAAHRALVELGDTWEGRDSVAGVLLIADGDKVPGSSMNTVGSASSDASGIRVWWRQTLDDPRGKGHQVFKPTSELPAVADVPGTYLPRSIHVADSGDIVADHNLGTLANWQRSQDTHTSYRNRDDLLTEGAKRLGDLVRGAHLRQLNASTGPSQASRAVVSGNSLHYVARSASLQLSLVTKRSADSSWESMDLGLPAKVGSSVVGEPVAIADGSTIHVFGRTERNTLIHWRIEGAQVKATAVGTGLLGSPMVTLLDTRALDPGRSGNQVHAFGVNAQGLLGHWWVEPEGTVRQDVWTAAGALKKDSQVSAYTFKDQQHVFARSADDGLRHCWWYPGILRNLPRCDQWAAPGRVLSDPAGFPYRSRQQHVFYLTAGSELVHKFWQEEVPLITQLLGEHWIGNPSVYTDDNRQYAVGRDRNGRLKVLAWDIATQTDGKVTFADDAKLTADPAVTSWLGTLVVLARDGSGHLRMWRLDRANWSETLQLR